MLQQVLARRTRQRLEAQLVLRPVPVALVADVGALQEERYPPDLVLGEQYLEGWEAVEEAGQCPLDGGHRSAALDGTEPRHLLREAPPRRLQLLQQFRRGLGVVEERALAGAFDVNVDGHRHVEVERRLPEPVVFNGRVLLAGREVLQHDRLRADLLAVLQLLDVGVQILDDGHDGHADEAVRVLGAVVLDEPVVVRADDGQVRLVVVHHPPHPRAGGLRGEEHLGVDAVDVLFLHALLGRARSGRALVLHAGRQVVLAAPAAVQVGWVRLARLLAVDEPGVGVVVDAHELGSAVAMLLRNARRPVCGVDLHVGVTGDVVVVHSTASWRWRFVRAVRRPFYRPRDSTPKPGGGLRTLQPGRSKSGRGDVEVPQNLGYCARCEVLVSLIGDSG